MVPGSFLCNCLQMSTDENKELNDKEAKSGFGGTHPCTQVSKGAAKACVFSWFSRDVGFTAPKARKLDDLRSVSLGSHHVYFASLGTAELTLPGHICHPPPMYTSVKYIHIYENKALCCGFSDI